MRMEFTAIRDLTRANSRNLIVVAVLLRRESGALLLGEKTNHVIIRRGRKVICDDSSVDNVGDLLTKQPGPGRVLVNVDIRFRRGLDVQELELAIDSYREEHPAERADGQTGFYRGRFTAKPVEISDSGKTMSSRLSMRMRNSQKRFAI
jgi:hypothetical protein